MSTRIKEQFDRLTANKRKGLVTFITACDPNIDTCWEIVKGLPQAGADFIELGMPFSDPMADGPAIQLANQRALANGMTLRKTLSLVERFRKEDQLTPIILMGYYNPIYRYGVEAFIEDANNAGIDGLIIVDLPAEEDSELCHPAQIKQIDWIRLTTPTSDDTRLKTILKHTSGFVYYVSIAGITGTQSAPEDSIRSAVERIHRHTDLPVAVGFGIKTVDDVRSISQISEAVVVGSAIVDQIKLGTELKETSQDLASRVHTFVSALAEGLKPSK